MPYNPFAVLPLQPNLDDDNQNPTTGNNFNRNNGNNFNNNNNNQATLPPFEGGNKSYITIIKTGELKLIAFYIV